MRLGARRVGQAILPAAGFQPAGPAGKQASRLSSLTVVVAFLGGGAWAQIQQPQLGTMLTRDGAPRAVFGVAGSVTIGDPLAASNPTSGPTVSNAPASGGVLPILNLGCSRRMCLMKTDSAIVSYTGLTPGLPTGSTPKVVDAPAGPALFWFEGSTASGNSALVYFPRSRQLERWQNGQLSPVDFDVTGEILSIGEASDGTLQFAVRNLAGTWVVRSGDVVVASLHGPESTGPLGSTSPVLLLHGGVLFATSDGLILRRPDQSELVFKLGGGEVAAAGASHVEGAPAGLQQIALSWLGENYVQVRVRGSGGDYSDYALRVDLGHERMFMLPEPQQ